jgi:hypothetical protein
MASINALADQISYQDAYAQISRYQHSEGGLLKQMTKAIEVNDSTMIAAITAYAKKQGWAVGIGIEQAALRTHVAFTEVFVDYQQSVAQIRANLTTGNISAQYASDQFDTIAKSQGWDDKISAITQTSQVVAAAADATLTAARANLTTPTGDTQDQLLTEMRLGRAWERILREFGTTNADPLRTLTRKLEHSTDPYELLALLTEGPSWLRANGIKDPDAVMTAELVRVYPAIADATRNATAAHKFDITVRYDANVLRRMLTDTSAAAAELRTEGYVDPTTVDYYANV